MDTRKYYTAFKKAEKLKMYYMNKTYWILLLRFNIPFNPSFKGVVITPRLTYYSKDIQMIKDMTPKEMVSKIIFKSNAEYTYKMSELDTFSEDHMTSTLMAISTSYSKTKDDMEQMFFYKTDPIQYFSGMMSVDKKMKPNNLRFYLNRTELNMFSFDSMKKFTFNGINFSNMEELSKKVDLTSTMNELLVTYITSKSSVKKTKNLATGVSTTTNYQLSLNTMMTGMMSNSRMDFYCRARHDLFGQAFLETFGITSPKFDQDIVTYFGYTGEDSNRTPDFIYEMADKIMIIDFAVTRMDAGKVRDMKVNKYANLCYNLTKFIGKQVEPSAVVWKITDMDEMQIPPEFQTVRSSIKKNEVIRFLYSLQANIMLRPDYEKYKNMDYYDPDMSTEVEDIQKDILENMAKIRSKFLTNSDNMLTTDIALSRKDMLMSEKVSSGMMTSTNSNNMEFKKVADDLMALDENAYFRMVSDNLYDMVKNKDMPVYQKSFMDFDIIKIKEVMDKNIKKQESLRKTDSAIANISKMFPFPMAMVSKENMMELNMDKFTDLFGCDEILDDGTMFYNSTFDYNIRKDKENKEKNMFGYDMMGIGMDLEMDEAKVDTVVSLMSETNNISMSFEDLNYDADLTKEIKFREFKETNLWKNVCFLSDMFENLAYMEGRRYVFSPSDSEKRKDVKGMTVYKNFLGYSLMVKKGSRLTKEKQIRFKVFIPKKSLMMEGNSYLKNMMELEERPGMMVSNWLTAKSTDFTHFMKIKEVTMNLFSNAIDKFEEVNKREPEFEEVFEKNFIMMILILMENKRGTSTTNQLWRYLVHSSTSYISNRTGMMKDIFKNPIRSIIEAYIINKQANWYYESMKLSKEHWMDRIKNMFSTSNDYDRFFVKSFFDSNRMMEFTQIMDYMYMTNLFDKESGFTDHRMKAIMSKMMTQEIHFRENKFKPESRGFIGDMKSFWKDFDELHTYDSSFVVSMTKNYFSTKVNKTKFLEAVNIAMNSTIKTAMMMSSSLVSGPFKSRMMKYTSEVEKSKSFLTIFDAIEEMTTADLLEMNNKMEFMDAIFALFPKSQIGGPREILIQQIRCRLMIKFLETLSKEMCKIHEKEMLTKDNQKASIQSETMSMMKEEMRSMRNSGKTSIYFTFNSDATKWSPGFVMEHFFIFINSMPLPSELKTVILNTISSFSSKKMLVPEFMKEKWMKKPPSQKEYDSALEEFRKESNENNGVVELMSGMGQGMFHYLSSLYHCISDDAVDNIVQRTIFKLYGVTIKSRTLLSSDDKTKMVMMIFSNNIMNSENVIKDYMAIMDCANRMTNIHTNWKKSAVHFSITEFNSLFSIGKRMVWATIKDLYTANSVPDLSVPEDAIQQFYGSIRRCLEHGCYERTLMVMLKQARAQMMRYYKLNTSITNTISEILNCKKELLPIHLGFLNTKNPYSTLIYGKEITMFHTDNSKELDKFYYNLYSASKSEVTSKVKNLIPFSEDSKGRYWLEINMRLDKNLKEMKKEFFSNKLSMNMEDIIDSMNMYALNINLEENDNKEVRKFIREFFIGMNKNFSMNEVMPVHSVVRALQYSNKSASIMPPTPEMIEAEDMIMDIEKKVMLMNKGGLRLNLAEMKELKEKKDSCMKIMDNMKMDFISFTKHILDMKATKSSINLYASMREINEAEENIQMQKDTWSKNTKYNHNVFRTIRFFMADKGLAASPEDLINFIMDESYPASNPVLSTIMEIFDIKSRTQTKAMFSNPFKEIENLMKASKFPMKEFVDYLNFNVKKMKMISMSMMSSFPCHGNMKDNLMMLIRTRTSAIYNYYDKEDMLDKIPGAMKFKTEISLGQELTLPTRITPDSMYMIYHSDSQIERSMKMYFSSREVIVNAEEYLFERIEYSKVRNYKEKCWEHMWTNLTTVMVAKEYENEVSYMIYLDPKIPEMGLMDKKILMVFNKFREEMNRIRKKEKFLTKGARFYEMDLFYSKSNIWVTTYIKRKKIKWEIRMKIGVYKRVEDSDSTNELFDMVLMSDNYTVDPVEMGNMNIRDEYGETTSLKFIKDDPPDMVSMSKIMKTNSLLKEITLMTTKKEEAKMTAKERMMMYDVDEFNNQLSSTVSLFKLTNLLATSEFKKAVVFDEEDIVSTETTTSITDNPEDTMRDYHKRVIKGKAWSEMMEEIDEDSDTEVDEINENNSNFISIINSLKIAMNKPYDEDIPPSTFMSTNTTLLRYLSSMMDKSFKSSMFMNKAEIEKTYNALKMRGSIEVFHNMVLWEIDKATKYEMTDEALLLSYNSFLKIIPSVLEIKPTSKLVRYGISMEGKFKNSLPMIVPAEEDTDFENKMTAFL